MIAPTRIAVPRREDYEDRASGDQAPCVICGRGVKRPFTQGLILVDGGGRAALPGTEDPNESGYVGFYPIGPECVKRYPALRPFVFRPARPAAR